METKGVNRIKTTKERVLVLDRDKQKVSRLTPALHPRIDNAVCDSRLFRGGCLIQYQYVWRNLGAPDEICKLLNGIRIPFIIKPPLLYPSNPVLLNYATNKSAQMSQQIDVMIRNQVLEEAEISRVFYQNFS